MAFEIITQNSDNSVTVSAVGGNLPRVMGTFESIDEYRALNATPTSEQLSAPDTSNLVVESIKKVFGFFRSRN